MDTKNPERGPMLIVPGERDHTVPHVLSNAAYRHQLKNPGVTEFVEIPGRGHALTIDDGWQGWRTWRWRSSAGSADGLLGPSRSPVR